MTLLRAAALPLTGDRAPFAFVFIAAVGATVFAGWRAGVIATVLGQALAWYWIVDPASYAAQKTEYIGGFIISLIAELVAIMIIGLYQREVDRAQSKREGQLGLLEKALKEIDHRTSNNYQTVLALVVAQAKSAGDSAVRDALQQVADRIGAIASASRKLAVASEGLQEIRIADHLQDLCDGIEKGLSREGLRLECSFDDLVLGADDTVCLSILVNELVTNALKHAFPDGRTGTIRISLRRAPKGLELKVEDSGVGIGANGNSRGSGLGTRLIDTFVKQLGAEHTVASDGAGTRHLVLVRR